MIVGWKIVLVARSVVSSNISSLPAMPTCYFILYINDSRWRRHVNSIFFVVECNSLWTFRVILFVEKGFRGATRAPSESLTIDMSSFEFNYVCIMIETLTHTTVYRYDCRIRTITNRTAKTYNGAVLQFPSERWHFRGGSKTLLYRTKQSERCGWENVWNKPKVNEKNLDY